ncbi:c-type cytochrome [Spiribacter halobius]|uniref:Cytochrome c4 n=1 Tax=Sediminicurvatus halobius TaxID=2182432 RepID=A0A2U2N9U7_9GAMM|nr:c-type cytochrome [Spiribacter halobius]PWG65883.1 cytochrome c4 [Spiribacter halobius]UEX79933.1 cytochrome c4 [Spiribacter halobius]
MIRQLSALVTLLLLAIPVAAQMVDGDPEAGQSKAQACAACHGANGNSGNPEWPNLAGQHADYIFQQLQHYKSGERQNSIMQGQAANLSEEDMADLAAYYATLEMEVGETSEELAELGRSIYLGGIGEKGVPACAACHGPAGQGIPGTGYPRLGGQKAVYTSQQLQAYRSGDRAGYGQASVMTSIAANLSDEEIEAVSSYVYGLYPADGEDAEEE